MTGYDACGAGFGFTFPPRSEVHKMIRKLQMAETRGHGGWGSGGPPWGAGGPWGPGGPWGGGRPGGSGRRGRGPGWPFEPDAGRGRGRAGRGDVRLAILALLKEGPRHGYQLIADIGERSGGAWNPSPGSIYPALSALQDEGLIDDEKIAGKKVFSLTESGRGYVAERADDLAKVFADNTPGAEHEEVTDLKELMWGVGGAAVTVLGTGTPEQRQKAREILARTRRELYLLLATEEDDPTDESTEE
jgi:DNA-binding PadR family transcriptional regulator